MPSEPWIKTDCLDSVPASAGHYSLYDGDCLISRGGGVTRNMRQAIADLLSRTWPVKEPRYRYLPDTDGSALAWLEGNMRKYRKIRRATLASLARRQAAVPRTERELTTTGLADTSTDPRQVPNLKGGVN